MSRIDVPYDPDQVQGEFGWLWTGTSLGQRDWALVYTDMPGGIDAAPQIRVIEPDVGSDADLLGHAYHWAGQPYLTASAPACEPGAALLVEMRLEGGAKLSACWMEDGPGARRAAEAIRAEMARAAVTTGRDRHTVARDALIACRDRIYELLRGWLCSECACHHDGTPELQTLLPSTRAEMTPDVRALQAAEAAIGRGASCPAWLGDALDTWPLNEGVTA